MTKTEVAEYLTKRGYEAEEIDGVVQIKNPVTAKQRKEIKKIFKEIGYISSYGWRILD